MTELWYWIAAHFRPRFVLTPLATRNVVYGSNGGGHTGYTDVFIFGIRVARVQRTSPW
jgi:hypothetical protein